MFAEEGATSRLCIPSSPFKAPASSPIMSWLTPKASQVPWGTMAYCDLGPQLVTRGVQESGLTYYPARTFNPIPVREWHKFLECGHDFTPDNYAVHMHHATWTHFNKLDVDATYDFDCLYEWLKRRYGVVTGELLPNHIKYPSPDWTEPPIVTPETRQLGPKVFRDGKIVQLDNMGRVL